MAWQMAYVDENDNNYPNSYWRVVSVENLNFDAKIAVYTFWGYKSDAARKNGKPPIGRKTYMLQGADFDAYTASTQTNVRVTGYDASIAVKDVLVTPAVPEVRDAQGNVVTPAVPAVYKSFFDGASAV